MKRAEKCGICERRRVVAFRILGTHSQGSGNVCKPCGRAYAIREKCEFCHCGQELWKKQNKLGLYCNKCHNKCFECVQGHKIENRYKAQNVFEDTLQEQRIKAYNNVLEALRAPYKNYSQQNPTREITPIEIVELLIEKEYWQ